MKTYFIIAIIFLAFSLGGCTTRENFDLKLIVAPESNSSVITQNDMNSAAEIISKRLNNSLGIRKENMKLDISGNQISLIISKADTSKTGAIKELITGYARLELWETYENKELTGYLTKANDLLKKMKVVPALKNAGAKEDFIAQNPLYGILRPMISAQGEPLPSCMIGLASGADTSKVNGYMHMPEVKALFPGDLKLMWSQNPYRNDTSKTFYELHALKVTTPDGKAPLDGSVIISAKPVTGPSQSDSKIDLTMNAEGTGKWARITRENLNRCIAVVINGYVRSYPRVMTEISGGRTEITGNFTADEANELVNIFKSGELAFKLKMVDEQIIKMK